jgi:hypothetical protein
MADTMATQKQIDANRKNARHSTGPKTPQGKAVVSRNALKHALLAQDSTLPGEDQKQVIEIYDSLEADLKPAGALEEFLVHHMASAQWRLQRLARIETGVLDASLDRLLRYEDDDDEDEKKTPEQEYQDQTLTLGKTLVKGKLGTDFWNLARYDNIIRRSFFKALAELQRLQKLRATQPKPAKDEIDQTNPIPEPRPLPATGPAPQIAGQQDPPCNIPDLRNIFTTSRLAQTPGLDAVGVDEGEVCLE